MLDNVEDQADHMNLVSANKDRQRIEVNVSTRDTAATGRRECAGCEAAVSREQRLQRQEGRARDVPLWAYRSAGFRRRCLR